MPEFDAEFEGYLRTDFVSDLKVNVVDEEIDIDQLLDNPPEFTDLDVRTSLPVEQNYLLPLTDSLEEVTNPIGKKRLYKEVGKVIDRVEMQLKEVGVSLLYPVRQLKEEFPQWLRANQALLKPDMSVQRMVGLFVRQIVVDAINSDFAKNMWFNKETSYRAFLRGYNGLWDSYFLADTDLSQKISTTLNEDPSALSTADLLDIFKDMVNAQDADFRTKPAAMKVFWCDGAYWDALYDAYTDKGLTNSGLAWINRTEAEEGALAYRGIEIRPYHHWKDNILKFDPAGAGKGKFERRIMLTLKQNFVLGLNDGANDAFVLDVTYDKREEDNILKTSYYADTVLKREKYVVVALSSQNTPFILPAVPTNAQELLEWPYFDVDNNKFGGINNSSDANVAAAVGATITLRGNNFTGVTGVTVDGTPQGSVTVVDDNTITFVGVAADGDVVVTNTIGSTTAAQTMTIS